MCARSRVCVPRDYCASVVPFFVYLYCGEDRGQNRPRASLEIAAATTRPPHDLYHSSQYSVTVRYSRVRSCQRRELNKAMGLAPGPPHAHLPAAQRRAADC